MRFLPRSLMGLLLLGVTLGLLALAVNTLRFAVYAQLNQDQRRFPWCDRVIAVNVFRIEPQTGMPELMAFGEHRRRKAVDVR